MLPLDVTFAAAAATGLGSATTSQICVPGDPALCCDSLKLAGLGDRLLYPNTTNYNEREESFFSINGRLQPRCIYQPRDAAEVSLGLATLLEVPTCQIAIRSGGHHHAAGCNNINDGVTIDLFNLDSVLYDATTKTTKVGPGAQWGDVYRYLDPMGLAVAGGRDATVGVGGLIIGGGNSFYSGRHGMVCDGVVRFEVVLATGEITLADRDNNSDLWLALKGGQSNFGIVTSFELDTFQTGLLWGGTVYYGPDKRDSLISAFTDFADKVDDHPPSSSILFWSWQPSIKATVIGTSLVNIDNDVYDEPHKAFYQIANLTSSMRSTTITDLTEELEFPGEIYDCIQFTFSFKNDARVMNKIVDLHDIAVAKFKDEGSDFVSVAMFQPLAPSYVREGLKRGGNVLGLDLFGETRIMAIIWLQVKPEYVGAAKKLVQAWYDEFRAYAKSVDRDSDWVYLNYAYASQDPISGYGKANVDKIRAAAAKYDPTGVFQTRVPGGFKISKVPI